MKSKLNRCLKDMNEVVEEIGEQKWANALHYARQEIQRAVEHTKCALEQLDLAEKEG